ncbi:NusG domain II-containing protein [Methylotenera sp.]|uniref:NusG domain II-containing protein n=1 Tax=Methylotenera sp. TaxID=2051956 RepID=UPI002ED8831D
MFKLPHYIKTRIKSKTHVMRAGDWCVLTAGIVLVAVLFQQLWSHDGATRVQIRLGDTIYGTYSLNQQRDIHVEGAIGSATVSIMNGRARFSKSPCHNQYCVHQGWLSRSGQAALCLPNQLSLELIGETKNYDSLNY